MTWPETFGDTTAEYIAAHDGAGFVGGLSSLFWASGPDATSFLQGIVSQDVEALAVGEVARSLLLGPRGKLVAVLWLLRGEGRVGIVTDADRLDETMADLGRWRMRVDVALEADQRPVFDVWGPQGDLHTGNGWVDVGGVLAAELSDVPIRRRLVAGIDADGLRDMAFTPIGGIVGTTVRIEVGEPRMGIDIDERTIPQESGLVPDAVSFTKGCYLGQELVARIDTRGRVNRHLRAVRLNQAVIPPVGADVILDDSVVGTLTSVGESLALRAPVAMALIRREAVPGSDVMVVWDGGAARGTIETLPLLASPV